MCVFTLVRGITPCNSPFSPSPTFSLAKVLAAVACNGKSWPYHGRAGATPAPIQTASLAPAFQGKPEAGCIKWKQSNQVDFSSLVPCNALYLHSCGSLLNTSTFWGAQHFHLTSFSGNLMPKWESWKYIRSGNAWMYESNHPFRKRGFYTRNATAEGWFFFRGVFTLQMKKPVS